MKEYRTITIRHIEAGEKIRSYWLVESTVLPNVKRRITDMDDAIEFADYYEKVALSMQHPC